MAAGNFPLLGDPPFGLGEEAAGEAIAVPAGSRFAVGDQVTGITAFLNGWGGYAGLVERAPVAPGQTLLMLGAAGSSGSTAIQLGKALGAMVIAVAGSEEKLQFCRHYGADHGVNYRADDLAARIAEITNGRGVDLIYDPVGGATAATALQSGRLTCRERCPQAPCTCG
jgi:NADPH2:quinone reductase